MSNIEKEIFPKLTQEGKMEAQNLMDKFKVILDGEVKKIIEDVFFDFYCNISNYIESDSWQNYRNQIRDGLRGYKNKNLLSKSDYTELRDAIYQGNREEIVKDLNQDLIEEIESLKKEVDRLEYER